MKELRFMDGEWQMVQRGSNEGMDTVEIFNIREAKIKKLVDGVLELEMTKYTINKGINFYITPCCNIYGKINNIKLANHAPDCIYELAKELKNDQY